MCEEARRVLQGDAGCSACYCGYASADPLRRILSTRAGQGHAADAGARACVADKWQALGETVGVAESSNTARVLSHEDIAAGVVARFQQVVRDQPGAIAIADDATELSYQQLAHSAAGVLRLLSDALEDLDPPPVSRGADAFGAREPVAMIAGHHSGAVSALLGVIASGHPVLVLDPRTPAPRLRQFIERLQVRLIAVDGEHEPLARELSPQIVVPLRTARAHDPDVLWRNPPDPRSVAVVAFTSGSTGNPKPVANDHTLLMRDAWNSAIATGCYGAGDRIAHTLPMAFHAGLTTTVHGLVVGATMRLYDARARGVGGLAPFIARHGCSLMIASPGILRGFSATRPDPAQLSSLTSLTIAGESAYAADVEAIRPLLPPSCVVRNRYGSSETGLIAEYAVSADHPPLTGQLPVGRGVGRTVVSVVEESGAAARVGRTGTITVTAPVLANGYWDAPDPTTRAFRDNPDGTRTYRTSDLGRMDADGLVHIVGRADHSVKIHGYLVDPGEVDAALFSLADVREAVVVGAPRPGGERHRLIAYVVPGDRRPDEAELRSALRATLPMHMVPEVFVYLDGLPRSDRGKIDRSALPPPPSETAEEVLSHWEQLVAGQWAEVLELDRGVVPSDDFFALGGDSLGAEALMTRLVEDLGVRADIAKTGLLTEAPTLREFSSRLRDPARVSRGALVRLNPVGGRPPVFFIAGGGGLGMVFYALARRLGPDQPSYALQNRALESRALPQFSVAAMARRYIADLRRVQPKGPYYLAGHSFGGLVALEMAHQLSAKGQRVARLIILDSFPPDPDLHPPVTRLRLGQRLRAYVGLIRAGLRHTPGAADPWRFFVQSGEVGLRYRGRPWSGDTLVVVADSSLKSIRSQWAPFLTGRWRHVEVSGDHESMLTAPWVDEIAVAVREYLAPPQEHTGAAHGDGQRAAVSQPCAP